MKFELYIRRIIKHHRMYQNIFIKNWESMKIRKYIGRKVCKKERGEKKNKPAMKDDTLK